VGLARRVGEAVIGAGVAAGRKTGRIDSAPRFDRLRVGVLGDQFYGLVAAVRALHGAGCEPWFLTWDGDSYTRRSRRLAGTTEIPDPEAASFAGEVALTAAGIGAAVVLPGTEAALRGLSGRLDAFDPGVMVGCPPAETVDAALDKPTLERLARQAELALPWTLEGSAGEIAESADRLRFPVVLKQARSYTPGVPRIRASVHDDPESIRRFLAERASGSSWFVQDLVRGDLVAVAGVAWEGRLVSSLHQLAERVYPAFAGGGSYQRTIVPSESLTAAVGRLVAATGWSGIYHAQFIRADQDYLIDFNPRVYGSLALAISAGHNLMEYWVALLMGSEPKVSPYRVGVRYRALILDVPGIATKLRHGPRAEAARALVPHRRTTHAVLTVTDPQPALLIGRKIWARLSEKARPRLSRRGRTLLLVVALVALGSAATRGAAAQSDELRIHLTKRQNELARTTGLRRRDLPPVFAGGFIAARPSTTRCGSLTPRPADVTVTGFAQASFRDPDGKSVSSAVSILAIRAMVDDDFRTIGTSFATCVGRMFATTSKSTLVSARRIRYSDSLDHVASYRVLLRRGKSDEAISYYVFGEGRIKATLTVRSAGRSVPVALERLARSLLESRMED
jgi:predicted ATP-grasp superfamily ATP-dependent carboligase